MVNSCFLFPFTICCNKPSLMHLVPKAPKGWPDPSWDITLLYWILPETILSKNYLPASIERHNLSANTILCEMYSHSPIGGHNPIWNFFPFFFFLYLLHQISYHSPIGRYSIWWILFLFPIGQHNHGEISCHSPIGGHKPEWCSSYFTFSKAVLLPFF